MPTILKGVTSEVTIGADLPTVIIGERINPTGRKVFTAELQAGNLSRVAQDAQTQVKAGAAVLDVNVGAVGVDEPRLLADAVRLVQATVDVPVCIDSPDPAALRAGLKACKGRALVNSVNGEIQRLNLVLPIVAEYGAAVIALCMDDKGIPATAEERLAVAERILEGAQKAGIAPQDVVFDPLALTVGTDHTAAMVTMQTARLIREKFGCNLTIGASNVSHGMPERDLLNAAFLTLVIQAGVNMPICNPLKNGLAVRAADLLLGRDEWGMNYIQTYRAVQVMQRET